MPIRGFFLHMGWNILLLCALCFEKAGRSLCAPGHSAKAELLGHATGLLAYASEEVFLCEKRQFA